MSGSTPAIIAMRGVGRRASTCLAIFSRVRRSVRLSLVVEFGWIIAKPLRLRLNKRSSQQFGTHRLMAGAGVPAISFFSGGIFPVTSVHSYSLKRSGRVCKPDSSKSFGVSASYVVSSSFAITLILSIFPETWAAFGQRLDNGNSMIRSAWNLMDNRHPISRRVEVNAQIA